MANVNDLLNRATALHRSGKLREAIELGERAVAAAPHAADTNHFYAMLLNQAGDRARAAEHLERALNADPKRLVLWKALAEVRGGLGRWGPAAEALRRVVAAEPDQPGWRSRLTTALLNARDGAAAEAVFRESIARFPQSAALPSDFGVFLAMSARADEAVEVLGSARERHPTDARIQGNLCAAMNYWDGSEAERNFAEHKRYGDLLGAPGAATVHGNDRSPDRVLRIGYISSDFREGSVAAFIEPVLGAHDRSQFHAACYSSAAPDAVTARMQSAVPVWRDIRGRKEEEVAGQVRADGIDLLVELGGLTAGNHLPVMRHRPAPVQATWIGYPNTTGLPAIGWRIVDGVTDPPGADGLAVEKLWRLDPCFLCYRAHDAAPAVRPREPGAAITFGSFNLLAKVSGVTIELWSRVLREAPGSRLVIKSYVLEYAGVPERIRKRFAACGIEASRLDLLPMSATTTAHLELYHRIDVALDPFPYHGTTTTCEALWMGVPVVTLEGRVHASRVGPSLLSCVGLRDWIAHTPEEYVAIAAGLARDAGGRAALRGSLRDRVRASPLMDAPAFTQRLEAGYRAMWREWAAG